MAKTKFYSIMDGKHPLSRKQKALYNYLLPIINKEVILLVSKDDGGDDNILDVVNGDSFLELNQNGLAVCDTFVNENGLIEYYVICFYDTSDVKEYEKTTWDISRHPEKGENFDGLGYSDLIIIDDKGNLLKCSQKTSLFESKKSARKSIKESYLDEVTNLYFFDLDVDEECEVQLENFVMPCRISQFYKNDRYMYLIVQSKTSDETYFVITYNYKKNKFVSSKVFSSYREAKNQLVDTIAMVF